MGGKKKEDKKAAPKKEKEGGEKKGGKAKKKKWTKGKVRDKLNNLVLFDKVTYDKLYKEVPAYKLITPSVISERLKIRASLARYALEELEKKGLIRLVTKHHSQLIYTRNTKAGEEKAEEEKAAAAAAGGKGADKGGKGGEKKQQQKGKKAAPAAAPAAAGSASKKKGAAAATKKKATSAAKAVKEGGVRRHAHSQRLKVHFYRPRTFQPHRKPKYSRRSTVRAQKLDQYSILKYPMATESVMRKVEDHNTLVFIVDIKANKRQIKDAVNRMYGVKSDKVNTLIRPDGAKKAFVRLTSDFQALEVANKIGLV